MAVISDWALPCGRRFRDGLDVGSAKELACCSVSESSSIIKPDSYEGAQRKKGRP